MARRKLKAIFGIVFLICVVCFAVYGFKSNKSNKTKSVSSKCGFTVLEAMPSSNAKLRLLDHTYYQIGYSIQHKQAAYVAYLLTADMVRNNDNAKRGSTNFKKDPLLSKHYSVTQDYKNSGFVRGHLCPSKDMCWSFPSMKETFYMSNVSPQRESFNNGIWKKLENQVREWALENDSIIVITGPVLSTKYETIGENQVSVCKKFYKLVIDISYPNQKMIAFVMDNANQKGSVYKYSCTVKDVEQITDLNFFPSFESDPIVDSLEKNVNIGLWKSVK
ncbi:MAG: DNA/RNA non-specific endonuclease [Bacteroidales bacterium]|nr:DNA/RNA non-specific endonuclease [Bacteroidales bacterium]